VLLFAGVVGLEVPLIVLEGLLRLKGEVLPELLGPKTGGL